VKLVKKTGQEKCGEAYDVDVKRATLSVVDGLEVHMLGKVTGPGGSKMQKIDCAFEISADKTDATLLDVQGGPDSDSLDGDLGGGDLGVVEMEGDLCEADEKSSLSQEDAKVAELLQQHSMGELSHCKGYEHVNDGLPKLRMVSQRLGDQVPEALDLVNKYPQCFPNGGEEVARNQGSCGSCWAFASASATMGTLCISSSKESLASATDRFEVSVGQIMSCNTAQGGLGCDGGYASAAGEALGKGIVKERQDLYKCGGGDPKKHFEESAEACTQFPWGTTCKASSLAVPSWKFEGVRRVDGEEDMMAMIAFGNTLYVSFDVYSNLWDLPKGAIYRGPAGPPAKKEGGHAVTLVGYGAEGGVKLWKIQNSWGASWQENGFGKFERGVNLAGIEEGAYWMQAFVEGGKRLTCSDTDQDSTGDPWGDKCTFYNSSPGYCGGQYDDDDFKCDKMCCGCGGGDLVETGR